MIIFGLGKFAKVMDWYLNADSFTVHKAYMPSGFESPVVAFEDLEPSDLLIAIGPTNVNANREAIYYEAVKRGHHLQMFWHQDAILNGTIGDYCIIFERNNLQPFSRIENNVVLWSGNHIGHHSKIGSHSFISSHCVISGSVTIGERCFLGVNSSIVQGVTIGNRCVVGAGAVVTHDMPDDSVWGREGLTRVKSDQVKL